VNCKPITWMDR